MIPKAGDTIQKKIGPKNAITAKTTSIPGVDKLKN